MTGRPGELELERWAVLGMGASGIAAANLLASLGKQVTLSDIRPDGELAALSATLHPKIHLVAGTNHVGDAQIVVTSPGLKPSLPVFAGLGERLPVVSDIELAFWLSSAPWLTITGTDGKTTTTALVGEIVGHTDIPHVVAGNIGIPLCEVAPGVPEEGVVVAEVSAFQLWSTRHFRPLAACLTNLAPDHLDYFEGDWAAYVGAKKKMIASMRGEDMLWLPAHDPEGLRWQEGFAGQVGVFGNSREAVAGAPNALWSEDSRLWAREGGRELGAWCEDVGRLGIQGAHNVRNMLAAAGLCRSVGLSFDTILAGLTSFKGLPHRFETVATIRGIRWIDDSKATNAHAALTGLRGLREPYVAIVGGVDKGLELGEFVWELMTHATGVVAIGELQGRLESAWREAGGEPERLKKADSMEVAVAMGEAMATVTAAQAVVLSPAASSFDMFRSYAHRGEVFAACVKTLR